MKAIIYPGTCQGEVKIPASKSMSHRAILAASLAKGKSIIKDVALSQDIETTIQGMRQLGAKIEWENDQLVIQGIETLELNKDLEVECNESGSSLRFFIPLFAYTGGKIKFKGKNRLFKRPQKIYEEIFLQQGHTFLQEKDELIVQGRLKAGNYIIPGDISSQFISGLLFLLPLLDGDSTITIEEPYESKSYVDLTLSTLKQFGIKIIQNGNCYKIVGNQIYQPQEVTVEKDYSQFAFFAVLSAINHPIRICGMNPESLQGDKEIVQILKKFNANVEEKKGIYQISANKLMGGDINLSNCPDLGPILCVLGMFSEGKTTIYQAQRLRLKESDRIQAMETELRKFNCEINSDKDTIWIKGGTEDPKEELYGWKDHRIVMALSIAATMLKKPTVIKGAEAIVKSYPTFFDDLRKLKIKVVLEDD